MKFWLGVAVVLATALVVAESTHGDKVFRPTLPWMYRYHSNIQSLISNSTVLDISLRERKLQERIVTYQVNELQATLFSNSDTAIVKENSSLSYRLPKNHLLRNIFKEEKWGLFAPTIYERVWDLLTTNVHYLRQKNLIKIGCMATVEHSLDMQSIHGQISIHIKSRWVERHDSVPNTYTEPIYMLIDVDAKEYDVSFFQTLFILYDFEAEVLGEHLNEMGSWKVDSGKSLPRLPSTFTYNLEENFICNDLDVFFDSFYQVERFTCRKYDKSAIVDHRSGKVTVVDDGSYCRGYRVGEEVFMYPQYSINLNSTTTSSLKHFGMDLHGKMPSLDSKANEKVYSRMSPVHTYLWYFSNRFHSYEESLYFSELERILISSRNSISEVLIRNFTSNRFPEGTFDIIRCTNIDKRQFSFVFDLVPVVCEYLDEKILQKRSRRVLTTDLDISTTRLGDITIKISGNRLTINFTIAENPDNDEKDLEFIENLVNELDLNRLCPYTEGHSFADSLKYPWSWIEEYETSWDWLLALEPFLPDSGAIDFILMTLSASLLLWTWYVIDCRKITCNLC